LSRGDYSFKPRTFVETRRTAYGLRPLVRMSFQSSTILQKPSG